MEKFPFYNTEPKARLAKLREHFNKFEEESSSITIEQELQKYRDNITQALNTVISDKQVLIKCGDKLLLEVDSGCVKELLEHIKDV
ncbi:hypothetical protein BBOV_III007305 [Babesia bovis T2Bo]|uniref:hypothetical protein n=1 Tax=Babesia bovis T2Bo TaxID=484906 RepID=UPI001C3613B0|nr:hypothetical protein BBOV_III007305 [Babesia bovis T2Bo]KAG6440073.1 hypothetical protein BBOV_III007305 [Babesia bovis T2Bo]